METSELGLGVQSGLVPTEKNHEIGPQEAFGEARSSPLGGGTMSASSLLEKKGGVQIKGLAGARDPGTWPRRRCRLRVHFLSQSIKN